jgi:hypothetical protein
VDYRIDQPPGVPVTLHATFGASQTPAPPRAIGRITFHVVQPAGTPENISGEYTSAPIAWSGLSAQSLSLVGWRGYPAGVVYNPCVKARHVRPRQRLSIAMVVSPARPRVRVRLIEIQLSGSLRKRVVSTTTTDRRGRCVFHLRARHGRFGLVGHALAGGAFVAADSTNALAYDATGRPAR